MWMFGILTSAFGGKCEPAHEAGKDSKARSAVPVSLVSGVSCGLHLMNFNLNVTIFVEWQLDITECKTEKPPQWEVFEGSCRFSLWAPSLSCEVPENLQFYKRRNVDLPERCLWKVYLGPLHTETSLGSSTIPDPSASLLEGSWNLEGWASTHLGQEIPVWWGITTRRWPREDFLYGWNVCFVQEDPGMWFLVSTCSSWLCQGGIWCPWQVYSYSEVYSRMCSRVCNDLVCRDSEHIKNPLLLVIQDLYVPMVSGSLIKGYPNLNSFTSESLEKP